MAATYCDHCGLPVLAATRAAGRDGAVYCCYGCRLVSRLVGRHDQQGARAWDVLRLAVGALLSMEVMMLSALLYTGSVEPATVGVFRWVLLATSTPAVAILGYPFVLGAAGEIRRGRLSLDTLIAVGSLTALAVSAASTIRGRGHIYYDTATMLPTLVTFGKLIEAGAKTRAGAIVHALSALLPATALRLRIGGEPAQVPIGELRVGDRLSVSPGGLVPADGRIVAGTTTIHEAAFTGESRPRHCSSGDDVIAGTTSAGGPIVVEARAIGDDLLLRRIVRMVEQARGAPSRTVRLAERMATVFTPAVFALAAVAAACWLLAAGPAQASMTALAILVVACPCAMGIAAPLATAIAIARLAGEGVIVRGGQVLEDLGDLRTVYFDKTGTLTHARPALTAIQPAANPGQPAVTEHELLTCAAAIETNCPHPLARGVLAELAARGATPAVAGDVQIVPGRGLTGWVDYHGRRRQVVAGAPDFVTERLTAPDAPVRAASAVGPYGQAVSPASASVSSRAPQQQQDVARTGTPLDDATDGHSVVDVAWDGLLRGRFWFHDAVRDDAADAIARLKRLGVRCVLLSGDREPAARRVGEQVGIDQVHAPCSPAEKLAIMRARDDGRPSAIVGDGINDAPALAAADVGIAMAGGTDLARAAGNVLLLGDRLDRIAHLVSLGRQTRRIIRQNLAWAMGYNAVAIAAAAAGLLHPLLAAVAMVVSSVTVLGNSVRLRSFDDR